MKEVAIIAPVVTGSAKDVFASGVYPPEDCGGGCVRIAYYVDRKLPSGQIQREIVGRYVLSRCGFRRAARLYKDAIFEAVTASSSERQVGMN